MTSACISEWLCDPCKENGKEIQASTQCHGCHELLCEPCSDYHLRLKMSKDHHLIELVQIMKKSTSRHVPSSSKQTLTFVDKEELTSDFLEHVTLTEDTVLYRRAQVSMQSITSKSKKPTISEQVNTKQEKTTLSKPSKHTTSKHSDPRQLKATKCLQYSVRRPWDKVEVFVTGLLCMSHNVVVVDDVNNVLKLFDQSGIYLSSTTLKDDTWGITCVGDSTFATCGGDNTVDLWTVNGHTVVSEDVYHVNHRANSIYYNDMYSCVLHSENNSITLLNRQGRQVRKINMVEWCGMKFEFGWDIHMDSDTHNIYISCYYEYGVLCMTVEGGTLWFTPLSCPPFGITEIEGTLFVADNSNACLHMISKEGEYVRKLLDQEDLEGRPVCVCYGKDGKLYVSYKLCDKISVFTVT